MIIGICGAARSGKNTVADMLTEAMDAYTQQIQIADPLKAYLRDLFDWTREHTDGDLKDVPDKRYPSEGKVHVFVGSEQPGHTLVCHCGARVPSSESHLRKPGECVTYLTPRKAMQKLGGEWAESVYPKVYAQRAARIAKIAVDGPEQFDLAVVTDVRFLHDAQCLKEVGGILLMVERDGDGLTGKAAAHKGEMARTTPEFLALVDHNIYNNGTFADLQATVQWLVENALG